MSPYRFITTLLTMFCMLYIVSPRPIYKWKCIPPSPLHLFCPSPPLPFLWQPWVFLCISESVSVLLFFFFVHLFCFLDSTHTWNQSLSFCNLSLCIGPSMLSQTAIFHFLWLSNIPLLTYTNSIHLLMDTWASLIVRLVKMLLGSTGSGGFTGERIGYPLWYSWDSRVVHLVKNLPAMRETWVWFLGWEDPQEKGKATHSSNLAWRIPWTI